MDTCYHYFGIESRRSSSLDTTTMTNSQKYIGIPEYKEYNCQLEGIVTEIPIIEEQNNVMQNYYDWNSTDEFEFENVKIMVNRTMEIKKLVAIPGTSGIYTIEKKITNY